MQQKSSKQDSWSSLLSELGVEDPVQQATVPEPVSKEPEPEVVDAVVDVATHTVTTESVPSGKAGKFGMGIMPEIPSLSGTAKPGMPKKSEKMSFFDRLASISLFGAGTSEKIDPKVISPTAPEKSSLAEEILEPKKLQKVEETPSKTKDENRPQIGAVDPWSKIATQLEVRTKTVERETKSQTRRPEEVQPVSDSEAEIDEIPDIESMISFRNLPPKKKKIDDVKIDNVVVPERVEPVSELEPRKPYGVADSSPRDRRPREERKSGKYDSDKRGRRRGKPNWNTPREELESKHTCDEPMELDDLDLVTPSQKERVPFTSDALEDEEISNSSKMKSRNRRSRPRKLEEPHRRPDRTYADSKEEYEGDFEEDYEVLTPPPEREYGPPRDVFADLFPEGVTPDDAATSRSNFESGQRTRGSKMRGTPYQEESPVETEVTEESDPFAHFNKDHFSKRGGRGSQVDQPRRGDRRTETVVEEKRNRDVSFDEEDSHFRSDSSSRRRGAKARGRIRTENEEPMDEQSQQEEQEMAQLHRNIPGWEDAILPIIESNTARHANRPNGNRKGSRKEHR